MFKHPAILFSLLLTNSLITVGLILLPHSSLSSSQILTRTIFLVGSQTVFLSLGAVGIATLSDD